MVTTQPPASVAAGSEFGLTVTVEDASGSVDTSNNGTVTVALLNNPGGSTLVGTLTTTAQAGVATFSELTLNKVGSGYTLLVSASDVVGATTDAFDVYAGLGLGLGLVPHAGCDDAGELDRDLRRQGAEVVGDTSGLPAYAAFTTTGAATHIWAASSTAAAALQNPGGSGRIEAAWYSTTSFTVDLDLTDGQTHDLELYFLDLQSSPSRVEQVQISDAVTGAVLSTETIASFQNGVYLNWAVKGDLVITIMRQAGVNAVLSGLFFGPAMPAATAAFLKTDATTKGSWIGTYGAQGEDVVGDTSGLPAYATLTTTGAATHSGPPAPRRPRPSRIPAARAGSRPPGTRPPVSPSTWTSPTARPTTSSSTSSTCRARPAGSSRSRSATRSPGQS